VASAVPVPSASAEPVRAPLILGSYETGFRHKIKDQARAGNIRRNAELLNGAVIEPGATWSFNEHVGFRTKERGFKEAPGYFLGEIRPTLGGGTCQASSTVHAAAIYAGLEIVKRRPHSRPAKYIDRGLDATVSYEGEPDDLDLKIRNPFNEPITLEVSIRTGDPHCIKGEPKTHQETWIHVDVLGDATPVWVETRWRTGSQSPYQQRFRKTNTYRNAHKKLVQSGRPGEQGMLIITAWSDPDLTKKLWQRKVHSQYFPVHEVWEVGLAWDMDEKPWPQDAGTDGP